MSDVARLYRRFAEVEARGMSPMYEEWALAVADDAELSARIAELPPHKRQVNLVFAAARLHGVPLGPWPGEWMRERWDDLVPTILARATQTNEAGRCATLLPQLVDIPDPFALLEVGASAGLCLYPDRYSYRYRVVGPSTSSGTESAGTGTESAGAGTDAADAEFAVDPAEGPSPVVLPCTIEGADPPTRVPEVVWRAGIDLNPLDVGDPADLAWLETLVWPEHDDRRERLAAAAAFARADPPRLVAGDLLDELTRVADEAPPDATLVVFHSAVLVYLSPDDRMRFAALVDDVAASRPTVWLANEAVHVLPDVAASLDPGLDTRSAFVLSVDGAPRALVHPHGRWYRAL